MKKRTGLLIITAAFLVSPIGPFHWNKDQDPNGLWAGQFYTSDCGIDGGCATISIRGPGDSRVLTLSAPLRHLKGLSRERSDTGVLHFELRRPAGIVSFEGRRSGDEPAKGQFVFVPDDKYRDAADRLGFGELSANDLLPLFATNLSRPALAAYSELGYDLSIEEVGRLAEARVDPEVISELRMMGYERPSTETLVNLAKQGFDFDQLRVAHQETDVRRPLEEMVMPLPENAASPTIAALELMGDPALQEASLVLGDDRVARFQQALDAIGMYADEDGIRLMISRGLTPERIQEFAATGLRSASLEDLLAFQINKVDPSYVKAMLESGVPELGDAHGILAAKAAGLESHYVATMMAVGLADVRLEDLAQARRIGIGPVFAKQLIEAGVTNLTLRDLVLAEALGLDTEFVREIKRSGGHWATALDLASLLKARRLGVEPSAIRQYVDAGLGDAGFEEIINLHIAGVAPKFVRRYLGGNPAERDVPSIIRAWTQRAEPRF